MTMHFSCVTTPAAIELAAVELAAVDRAAQAAARQIPPVWPLASSVAVNPFLGQTGGGLAEAGARLARIGAVPVTMPRAWYQERLASGAISADDLAGALAACTDPPHPIDVADLQAIAASPAPARRALPTVADLAMHACAIDWPALVADRFGTFTAGYFDQGQALWEAPRGTSAWAAWRAYATHDLTPEIMGLKGFCAFVANTPDQPLLAIARAVQRLGLTDAALDTYFHQLLHSVGGWAHYARYLLWQAELAGDTDDTITALLAIRLLWEEALYCQHESAVAQVWAETVAAHTAPLVPDRDLVADAILQEAAERAGQRAIAATLAAPAPASAPRETRPALQAAFCIDVRSEVFRRALESVDPSIRTLGFAGFFGIATRHRGFASDVDELRLPVLLNPAIQSVTGAAQDAKVDQTTRYLARALRAWGRFKLAAVSSFAFVEAMGPVYVGKILRDTSGLGTRPRQGRPNRPDPAPQFDPALPDDARITAAETVLRAMSLTTGFARVVLLAGHGANVVNNPHASSLHCGACGGYSGEVNARLLAGLLNDPAVREGLIARGITVPADTLFVAALHDTTTDQVTLYAADCPAPDHASDLAQVRRWLSIAGELTRGERALRLPRAGSAGDIPGRSRDWAEVRPEWALAGCRAFIAAPRNRTSGHSLEGRAFLHDYDWQQDSLNSFAVLELIMTAPVVVASWISLQYYGSTVAPGTFGGGNKLLHNVVGGIGVLEGNGGPLRAGLPWQSVHDGDDFVHEPLRLSICIEAPREAMTAILARHDCVRALFDHRWLHLFAMDETGQLAWRYRGNLEWEAMADATAKPDGVSSLGVRAA